MEFGRAGRFQIHLLIPSLQRHTNMVKKKSASPKLCIFYDVDLVVGLS